MNTNLVTVFGGSGFLGRHTVRALAKAGWRIKVAVRHPNSAFFLRPLGSVGQIDIIKCDVTDAEAARLYHPLIHSSTRKMCTSPGPCTPMVSFISMSAVRDGPLINTADPASRKAFELSASSSVSTI